MEKPRVAVPALILITLAPVWSAPAGAHGRSQAGSSPLPGPAPVRVMITGFEPFRGSLVNRSDQVARVLAAHPELAGPGVEISYCRLPVVYDRAAETAERCYESAIDKPAIVLSLGESPFCEIRLETAARNRDDDPFVADNAGQVRLHRPILPEGPASIGFNLPVQDMFCALAPADRDRVLLSSSPGSYVCNNTAYRLANYFVSRPVQYGFVHVPDPDCRQASDPLQNAEAIGRMVRAVIDSDRGAAAARGPALLPRCGSPVRLPVSPEAIDGIALALTGQPGTECYSDFMRRLHSLGD